MSQQKRPIGIDLFCGAGGMTLGFEQAGFDILAAVDVDPIHCATHEFNFPKCTSICSSVADLSGEEIRRRSKIGSLDVDVVFGGAPCQGFSMIGKRILDDPRNQLVFHFVRLIKEIKPKYFVFENVKGLTVGDHRKLLEELIEEMGKAGYKVEQNYKVLNAADFGVPQDRQRLFLMGARRGQRIPIYPSPTTNYSIVKKSKVLISSDLTPFTTVGDAIGDLPNADKFSVLLEVDQVKTKLGKPSSYSAIMRGEVLDSKDFSYPRIWDSDLMTSSMRTVHTDESMARFDSTEPGSVEKISRFLRLDSKGVCNTLRAGTDSQRGAHTSPRPIHPKHARVITVREAARIHSYPDWFRMHRTKWHGFRQVGNSVPPLLARAVASSIMKSLGASAIKPKVLLKLNDLNLLAMNMSEASQYYGVPSNVIPQRERKASKLREEVEV